MGHLMFLFLHLVAVFCGFVLLFVTIPLHLVYTAIRSSKGSRRSAPCLLPLLLVLVAGCSSSSSDPAPAPEPEPEPEPQWVLIEVEIDGDLPLYVKYRPDVDSGTWVFFGNEEPIRPGDADSVMVPLLRDGYLVEYWSGDTGSHGLKLVADHTTYENCPTCCHEDDPCRFLVEIGFLLP